MNRFSSTVINVCIAIVGLCCKDSSQPAKNSTKQNTWVFIMAGQSNMAGRARIEKQDRIPNKRILAINERDDIVLAKEPLHFYEKNREGLDCGLSFAETLLKNIPDSITILLIPTAIGGSSVEQWLGDSTSHNVKVLSNFKEKVEMASQYGEIKGILWHQGESDANDNGGIKGYKERIARLFRIFRYEAADKNLPVLVGELGSYSRENDKWQQINQSIREYSETDQNTKVIPTNDLHDNGDKLHFNADGERKMGQRFAYEYLQIKRERP